jgi:hypothetical protein
MFEPTFADVLFGLFGPQWRQKAPLALGYSRRQLQRWVSGVAQPPRRVWILLGRRAVTARSDIEAWAEQEHERIDEAARQRLTAASGALTALKLLGIRELRRSRPADAEPGYLQHGAPRAMKPRRPRAGLPGMYKLL